MAGCLRTAFLLALLLGAAGLAGKELVADDRRELDRPAAELAALQGRWKAWIAEGDVLEIEVKGKTFTLIRHTAAGVSAPFSGSLVLNPEALPKRLDWVNVKIDGQDAPNNLCIYELSGDTWLLIGGGSELRPTHFFSGGGNGDKTWVLKRQKDMP